MELEEGADRLGDLAMALVAGYEAIVGVGTERLVRGTEPLRQAFRRRLWDVPVEACTDDEAGHVRQGSPVDRHTGQDLPPSPARLMGLLAEEVLIRRTSLIDRSRWSRWSRSGRVAQPTRPRP